MQNRAQMKVSKCGKDILKCASEKRRSNGLNLSVPCLSRAKFRNGVSLKCYEDNVPGHTI